MNAPEAAKILAILAAIDRREVDATTAQGWAWALADVPYERGLAAAERAIRSGDGYVDVQAIRKQLKAMQPGFERDVRSAKARGLVDASWPARTPLTIETEQQLRAAQAGDFGTNNDRAVEIGAPAHTNRRALADPATIRQLLAAHGPARTTK